MELAPHSEGPHTLPTCMEEGTGRVAEAQLSEKGRGRDSWATPRKPSEERDLQISILS